jgi:hypothetical protein
MTHDMTLAAGSTEEKSCTGRASGVNDRRTSANLRECIASCLRIRVTAAR